MDITKAYEAFISSSSLDRSNYFNIGLWCNSSMGISKIFGEGANPSGPVNK